MIFYQVKKEVLVKLGLAANPGMAILTLLRLTSCLDFVVYISKLNVWVTGRKE